MNGHPTSKQKNVFYVPAGVPFVDTLSKAVLQGHLPVHSACHNIAPPKIHDLPNWTILLPTRRAKRALIQSFIDQAGKEAILLPRIQPLGDVDEEELNFFMAHHGESTTDLPEPVSGLERQFILYRLVHDWVERHPDNPLSAMLSRNTIHAFELARSLGRFVDGFETSGVRLQTVDQLFDGEFAEHRQQILAFLQIVQLQLPKKLEEIGKIGSSEHRNRLMHFYTDFLARGLARGPVIAAGSTGSIPATAEMLSCIAGLENGAVVLPGLDMLLDEESWNHLPEHHPQFGMRELLGKFGITRQEVRLLPGLSDAGEFRPRAWLASEIMRPAETTDRWRQVVTTEKAAVLQATENVTILDADDQRHEAVTIALLMRNALHMKKSAALITPDRQLARNVKAELVRWRVEVDDSAGEPLLHTSRAMYFRLLLEAAQARFSPVALKALLSHKLSCFATPDGQKRKVFADLEIALLRSQTSYDGLSGLRELCQAFMQGRQENPYAHPAFKNLDQEDWQAICALADRLLDILEPLARGFENGTSCSLSDQVEIHLKVAEAASASLDQPSPLWVDDDGEKLADLFARMQSASGLAPPVTLEEYKVLLEAQMAEIIVRPTHVKHGSLAIYGLLEARMITSDIMILAGLNETVWPPASETDPWLTRPQLRLAGLPVPERRIGLTAHDFAQGFCAQKVYLTYAKKIGNAPAVPSRWILRLKALLQAADVEHACVSPPSEKWQQWARHLDKPDSFLPVKRPHPTPPVELRPTSFSVTGIETLIKNPYAFFADKILHLKEIPALDRQDGAAERGNLVHLALHKFVKKTPGKLPDDADELLLSEFTNALKGMVSDVSLRVFWQPQLVRMANWFVEQEKIFRQDLFASKTEVTGKFSFSAAGSTYTLTARADRIDLLLDGTVRLIDYKTGSVPRLTETSKDFSPQLLLEGLICLNGGFEDVPPVSPAILTYVKLSGGVPAGSVHNAEKNIGTMIEKARDGVSLLLSGYAQPNTAYQARSVPERPDDERAYDFLSRWREWGHLLDQEDEQ